MAKMMNDCWMIWDPKKEDWVTCSNHFFPDPDEIEFVHAKNVGKNKLYIYKYLSFLYVGKICSLTTNGKK
jgi:hypothetical protein